MKPVFLWLLWLACLIPALLVWPLWLAVAGVWLIARQFRPEGVKVTERNAARVRTSQRQHRIRTAVQMQLAAHGLPDTPENRAQVLQALAVER
jgi:hypothetical protein